MFLHALLKLMSIEITLIYLGPLFISPVMAERIFFSNHHKDRFLLGSLNWEDVDYRRVLWGTSGVCADFFSPISIAVVSQFTSREF